MKTVDTQTVDTAATTLGTDLSDIANALLDNVEAVLEDFSDADLNALPEGLSNNPFSLICHLLGSARYWIGEVVGEMPSQRVRADEFGRTGEKQELKERLTDTRERIEKTLQAVDGGALEPRNIDLSLGVLSWGTLPSEGRSSAWVLTHDLCHIAYHLGQLKLLLLQAEDSVNHTPEL